MEFKKCVRCGCFFASDDDVCCNCHSKDELDISRLNTFLDNSFVEHSVSSLAAGTGISEKNINRFIENKSFNLSV